MSKTENDRFWLEFWSLWNQLGCLIEREMLGREKTSADMRAIAKKVLEEERQKRQGCG
jgi:hypothetical protein